MENVELFPTRYHMGQTRSAAFRDKIICPTWAMCAFVRRWPIKFLKGSLVVDLNVAQDVLLVVSKGTSGLLRPRRIGEKRASVGVTLCLKMFIPHMNVVYSIGKRTLAE